MLLLLSISSSAAPCACSVARISAALHKRVVKGVRFLRAIWSDYEPTSDILGLGSFSTGQGCLCCLCSRRRRTRMRRNERLRRWASVCFRRHTRSDGYVGSGYSFTAFTELTKTQPFQEHRSFYSGITAMLCISVLRAW